MKIGLRLFGVLVLACGWTAVAKAQDPPRSVVSIIVDVSKSFAPLDHDDEQTLDQVAAELLTLAQSYWDRPVSFGWTMITSNSVVAKRPCGPAVTYNERLIAANAPRGELTRPDQLQKWFQECIQAVVGRPEAEAYTDISGAIAMAAFNHSRAKNRIVVLYSDLLEDLAPGMRPAPLTLQGEQVMLLVKPEAGDRRNPAALFERLDAWKKKLMEAGASSVCAAMAPNLNPGDVTGCFHPGSD